MAKIGLFADKKNGPKRNRDVLSDVPAGIML
jgi:hypothetical protein